MTSLSPEIPDSYSTHYTKIRDHDLVKKLLSDGKYELTHPYDSEGASYSLTAGTLVGDDLIAKTPCVIRTKQEVADETGESELFAFYYLGERLCGHKGIIHGGLLATIMDEGLCQCGFPLLPNKIGVTAKLDLTYLAPVSAGGIILLKAKTSKAEGRKCWVEGEIRTVEHGEKYNGEDIDDLVVNTKANLLVVEPKWASKLSYPNKS